MCKRPTPLNVQYSVPTTQLQAENGSVDMSVIMTADAYLKDEADAYMDHLEKQVAEKDKIIQELQQRIARKSVPTDCPENENPKLYRGTITGIV